MRFFLEVLIQNRQMNKYSIIPATFSGLLVFLFKHFLQVQVISSGRPMNCGWELVDDQRYCAYRSDVRRIEVERIYT